MKRKKYDEDRGVEECPQLERKGRRSRTGCRGRLVSIACWTEVAVASWMSCPKSSGSVKRFSTLRLWGVSLHHCRQRRNHIGLMKIVR